jgi:hypothetical protein
MRKRDNTPADQAILHGHYRIPEKHACFLAEVIEGFPVHIPEPQELQRQ